MKIESEKFALSRRTPKFGKLIKLSLTAFSVFLITQTLISCSSSGSGSTKKPIKHGKTADVAISTHSFQLTAGDASWPADAMPIHDRYQLKVKYFDAPATLSFQKFPLVSSSLRPGQPILVEGAYRLTSQFLLQAWMGDALVMECETDGIDLRLNPKDLSMQCYRIDGKNRVAIFVPKQIQDTLDLSLLPSSAALKKAMAVAQSGTFVLRNEAQWAGETAYLLAQWSATNESGELSFLVLGKDGYKRFSAQTEMSIQQLAKFLAGEKVTFSKAKQHFTTGNQIDTDLSLSVKDPMQYVKMAANDFEARMSVIANSSALQGESTDSFHLRQVVTVASYNPENLWDANPTNSSLARGNLYFDYDPKWTNWYTEIVQKTKAKNVAHAIAVAGIPDVVGMQELESAENQSEVFQVGSPLRTELEALGYKYFVVGHQEADNVVSVTPGYISRYPLNVLPSLPIRLKEFLGRSDFSSFDASVKFELDRSARDMPVVELPLPGNQFRIYNGHWKSKGEPKNALGQVAVGASLAMRNATAAVLKQELLSQYLENPKKDIIVLGDLNTGYDEEPMKTLGVGQDKSSLRANPCAFGLYNMWYEVRPEDRWEYVFYDAGKRTPQTLSQMIVNHGVFDGSGLQYADQSFVVPGRSPVAGMSNGKFSVGGLLDSKGDPYRTQNRWGALLSDQEKAMCLAEYPGSKCLNFKVYGGPMNLATEPLELGLGYSDHLPLVATFRLLGN